MSTLDPEKLPLQGHQTQMIDKPTNANIPNARRLRLRQIIIVGLFVVSPMLIYQNYRDTKAWSSAETDSLRISSTGQQNLSISPVCQDSNGLGLVPLEAHIMSKCPDARDCLRDLVVPAMERIGDKVDFRLSFIGTYVAPLSCVLEFSYLCLETSGLRSLI